MTTDPSTEAEIAGPVGFGADDPVDYEIVVGRRQMSGVLFVAIVALVLVSSFSYLAGKAANPKAVEASVVAAAPVPVAPPVVAAPVVAAPVVAAPVVPAPAPELPLFAVPVANATYLQMGAVERGIAVIFAQGLRKSGLASFVAPGPDDKIFRVLIGPLKDPEAYRIAKEKVDAIGLSTFAKKYGN